MPNLLDLLGPMHGALQNLLQHDLHLSDNSRAPKILAVIDEIKKLADIAGTFIPQAAVVAAAVDEADVIAHAVIKVPVAPPVPVAAPVTVAPPVASANPSQPTSAPTPTPNQVLAADLEKLSQDLLNK